MALQHSDIASQATARTPHHPQWQPRYWLLALLPGLLIYAFEAAQLALFAQTRAPNVTLMTQLGVMLLFFALFALPLRAAFALASGLIIDRSSIYQAGLWARLMLAGLLFSGLHLFVLALLLRSMHSPPGWGVEHLLHSFAEVWMGNAGIWLIVFAACCGVMIFALWRLAERSQAGAPARLEVPSGRRLLSIPVQDIAWLEAAGNYVEVHSTQGSHLLRQPLKELESLLGVNRFLRSHRSALVNAAMVRAVRRHEGGYQVELSDGSRAPLSRRRMAEFKRLLAVTPQQPLTT